MNRDFLSSDASSIAMLIQLVIVCFIGYIAYYAGKDSGRNKAEKQIKALADLNRSSIVNMSADGPVYVIGHCAPDSDTVCSAIALPDCLTS